MPKYSSLAPISALPGGLFLKPDIPPIIPDSMDDEFNTGGVLNAKWTLVNDPTLSLATNLGYLTVPLIENLGTDNLAARVQVYQAAPSGAQTLAWIAKIALSVTSDSHQAEKGEFAQAGIYLMNSANDEYVASKVIISNFSEASALYGFVASEKTGDAAMASGVSRVFDITEFYYLKIVKSTANAYTSANTYSAYMSKNGVSWDLLGTDSITFTANCDRVGLMFRRPKTQAGAPTATAIVDFFRRID